ncbi:MAG: hypothetical protein OXH06_15850 [Gemmatimonadetes bacterium]|nr:hypothetical protein [Gemmatimonadota bacterium]
MDRDDVRQRLEALEDKLRWQKRAIAGLLVVFLFSAAPALTQAPKWFGMMIPSKLTSLSLRNSGSGDGVRLQGLSPNLAEITFLETEYDGLSKIAPEQIIDAGDTLRVGTLHIVNARGDVVAEIGSEESGDGSLKIGNNNGTLVSFVGVDQTGHGRIVVLNAASRPAAAMGADPSEQANGWVEIQSSSGSAAGFGVNQSGNAAIAAFNSDGKLVSGLGINSNGHGSLTIANAAGGAVNLLTVDGTGDGVMFMGNRNSDAVSVLGANENGHGFIGFLNASERVVAGMGADSTGIGGLSIEGGRFRATVDGNANGVAETRGNNGEVRWSSEAPAVGDTGTSTGLIGDFDGDGDVDFNDFLTFARNFGKTSG